MPLLAHPHIFREGGSSEKSNTVGPYYLYSHLSNPLFLNEANNVKLHNQLTD